MFGGVIERWVALAAFSDNILVRQGNHTRASEWQEHLVHAENDRMLFDTQLCWTIASQICDHEERALAFIRDWVNFLPHSVWLATSCTKSADRNCYLP